MERQCELKPTPKDDFTVPVKFGGDNKIVFDMKPLIRTMPCATLRDIGCFKNITPEEKAIMLFD